MRISSAYLNNIMRLTSNNIHHILPQTSTMSHGNACITILTYLHIHTKWQLFMNWLSTIATIAMTISWQIGWCLVVWSLSSLLFLIIELCTFNSDGCFLRFLRKRNSCLPSLRVFLLPKQSIEFLKKSLLVQVYKTSLHQRSQKDMFSTLHSSTCFLKWVMR